MIRLFRWLLMAQPRFRPCDGCDPSDPDIVRQLADALEAREATTNKDDDQSQY